MISLLTDFALVDEFVGVLHLVIERIAPGAPVVDLTHGLPRHDVRAGAVALWRLAPWLAPGVVVAVVDPGVGTARRPVAVETSWPAGRLVMIGPDNGLLFPAARAAPRLERAVVLDDAAYHLRRRAGSGATFDGRDVFAPAGAHAWLGAPVEDLGSSIDPASLVGEPLREATRFELDNMVGVEAEVLWVDHYGNAQLNLDESDLDDFGEAVEVRVGDDRFPATRSGSYAGLGGLGLVTDSYGKIALCLERSSAAALLGLEAGDGVRLVRSARPPAS